MSPLLFYIVDVFAETKYAGNQLAVFLNAGHLSFDAMRSIAREMNFSETTFILSSQPVNGGYDVRIFTPVAELPFAGHPTLGTAYVIQEALLKGQSSANADIHLNLDIRLNLKVGQIPVTIAPDHPNLLWMRQNPPTFGATVETDVMAEILGLRLPAFDDRFPIQEVSTGMPFIIVPLKHLSDLQAIQLERDRYFSLIEKTEAKAIFVFCPETRSPDNQISARMFGEAIGVIEDPATGSANGCFAGYLVQHRYYGHDQIAVRVEQGYEIHRPSLLQLRAHREGEAIVVSVGGQVILVAKGEFV